MKTYLRMASGLAGLAIAAGVCAGAARAESRGTHDDATMRTFGKPAAASTGTAAKTARATGTATGTATRTATRTTANTDTALGFTGAAGAKSITLRTTGATVFHGRREDTASLIVGHGFVRPVQPRQQPAATSRNGSYHASIEKYARANGVPVALALAVVRIESNYNPRARGRAGEIGLMQIKLQTARGMGYSGSASALYDPNTNLQWGMKYLAGAYKLSGGDTCGTIMRYQGGHYARRMSKVAVSYCGKVKRHMSGKWA